MSEILHAGLIALHDAGEWKGVLIQGPSGSGKSDLALRAIGRGFSLVADDRTVLWASAGRLFGAAPPALAGLIEARGLGVVPAPRRPFAEVRLVARCTEAALERVPEPAFATLAGIALPLFVLRPLEASAPEKLIRALSLLGARPQGRYHTALR